LFEEYFRRLYGMVQTDTGVIAAEKGLCFQDSADKFRMIEESGIPVVAPYAGSDERIADVRYKITRLGMRRLQPFLVSLYPQEIAALLGVGALDPLDERLFAVAKPFVSIYQERFGFTWRGDPLAEPEELIA
jgi:hypothetical protein